MQYDVKYRVVFFWKLDLNDYWTVIVCGAHKPAEHEIRSHKDSVK